MSFISRLLNKSGSPADPANAGSNAATPPTTLPQAPAASIQPMGRHLQRRFARGVQYNMKIVVRGDSNVGKSCLLARLQGGDFAEEYKPSEEIRVVSVHWNYKTTDDVIKVEVWDVVDKGRPKQASAPVLDAEWVDVYKGCHGVILMLDMTKAWTLTYVERELPRVPEGLPVLVLANHRDMGQHRSVTEAQARKAIRDSGRPLEATRYAEASMRNGYGLKYIHRFLNLPFLRLQRESLLAQLRTNAEDTETVVLELDLEEESEENSYDSLSLYRSSCISSKRAEDRRKGAEYQQQLRSKAEAATAAANAGADSQRSPAPVAKDSAAGGTVAREDSGEQQQRPAAPPPRLIPGCERYLMELQRAAQTPSQSNNPVVRGARPAASSSASSASAASYSRPEPAGAPRTSPAASAAAAAAAVAAASTTTVTSVDNFVPDEFDYNDDDNGDGLGGARLQLDRFLDEDEKPPTSMAKAAGGAAELDDSDEDDDAGRGNPMVAALAEDIDSEDDAVAAAAAARSSEESDAGSADSSVESVPPQAPPIAVVPEAKAEAAPTPEEAAVVDRDELENFLNDD